jgi:hypothetical protein
MRQIRRNVFETNSSSTHSIAFATKSEFEKWSNGELLYKDGWRDKSRFMTEDEAIADIKSSKYYNGELDDISTISKEEIYEIFREYDIYDYEHWGYDYESDVTHYTTPGGEEIVAVCYYGYDS